MTVVEPRPWRSAGPRVARAVRAVRPYLARAARAAVPRIARPAGAAAARITGPRTWRYTAGAATAGLALAAGAVTAAGPWDSTGQRTAERDRAVAQRHTGGADHDGTASGAASGPPRPAPSAGA
ncbi:D-alanyl-D-alanine carboxypeptidase, partial [Streptomyces sp. TRM76130]|nr:D-alanyl-D-alanine carboxypeptidase [Streptomyces sp. TRM76130]